MSCEEFYGQGVELLIRIKVCPGPAFLLPLEQTFLRDRKQGGSERLESQDKIMEKRGEETK